MLFYHGEQPWDGPKSLAEMVHLPVELESLREYIPSYKIHLIDPRTAILDDFTGDWRILMEALRYMGDKRGFSAYVEKHTDELESLSTESGEVLLALLGENWRLTDRKEEITVCTALEELKQDWKNEGLSQGRSEGLLLGENRIMTLVSYMIQDGLGDDILRLKTDEGFKKEMLVKYHL